MKENEKGMKEKNVIRIVFCKNNQRKKSVFSIIKV